MGAASELNSAWRAGDGRGVAHHGELLQGAFRRAGWHVRALVTLPYPGRGSTASFRPDDGPIRVEPGSKVKALRAAQLTLKGLGRPVCGELSVYSDLPEGWGLGSSTSDVTAAIRAVLDAFGAAAQPERIAYLAVAAESAVDPTMLVGRPVLFAQRQGRVVEQFGSELPPLRVLGFNADPAGRGALTDALSLPCYSGHERRRFDSLLDRLRTAIGDGNAADVAWVARESARLNQRFLPTPQFESLDRLVEEVGALGLQVAHSGTVAGLLFDPADPSLGEATARATRSLARLRIARTWQFTTSEA